LIEPLVTSTGLELVDVEHGPGLLRVILDREGGIDLEAITTASEQISDLLDVHDPVPGRYSLEVLSPGVERPLRTPGEFQRFIGETVAIRTHATVEGDRRVQGELTEADDESIVVAGRRLAYDEIERARTVFEWGSGNTDKPKPRGQRRR
jgi:ribosome maturation factor RimP